MARPPRFTQEQLREAVARSRSWAETLRNLRYATAGGNWRTVQKYCRIWSISSDHFDSDAAALEGLRRCAATPRPLSEVLVADSNYPRASLKRRLFSEGLKQKRCELCGQGDVWTGQRMALILDHVNGVPNDNRLENLRIVCPNCAATFATHCGRKNRTPNRQCRLCGKEFRVKRREQRYCSRACGQSVGRSVGMARRVAERPPHEQLMREIEQTSYLAVGRKYGVSDNAIRKWVRFYENETSEGGANDRGTSA